MDTLRVDICYRPIRLGWAVRRNDFDGLREAITLSHTMWGGRFNPILVVDEPAQAKRIAELFRVDLVAHIGNSAEAKQFADGFTHLPSPFFPDSLFVGDGERKEPHILDIHNAAVALQEQKQADAVKQLGVRLYTWQPDDPLANIFLIRYGAFPSTEKTGTDYAAILRDLFDAQPHAIDPAAALPQVLLKHPGCTVLSQYGLDPHFSIQSGGWIHPGFYVGSANNFDDLVIYWNLRAANHTLMFVDPEHLPRLADQMPAWREIIKDSTAHWDERRRGVGYWSRTENPHVPCRPPAGERVAIHAPLTEHSWNGMNIRAPMMYFGDARALGTVGRTEDRPRVAFQLSDRPFSSDTSFFTQHLIASVSVGDLYDDAFTFSPPYIPELNESLSRAMRIGPGRIRVEPERLGVVIDAADHDVSLGSFPVAELFERIFDIAGFSSKPSNGGLITRQLINRLDGLQGARAFKIPGVRRLLRTYGPQQSFSKRAALHLISSTDPENPGAKFSDHLDLFIERREVDTKLTPNDVFGYLVSKGLFRIGAELSCPACRLTSWTSLDALQQRVTCELCGQSYDATRQLVAEKWAYRRSGILGLEKNTQGAVPVALVLQQLDTGSHMSRQYYSASLELKPKAGGGEPCEVDFVWLRSGHGSRNAAIVFGECKDRGRDVIDENDIENLRRIADAVPSERLSAFILLAKLVPFEPAEIALAKTLNTEYQQRVILLTARELEPYFLYQRTAEEFDIERHDQSFEGMARTTARIYFADAPPVRRRPNQN